MKNPVYFNAACRLFEGENNYSCNVIINEVVDRSFIGYTEFYKIPEVRQYKKMLGIRHNDGIGFPLSFFDDRKDAYENCWASSGKRKNIRVLMLLLAYESGVGSDLIEENVV